MGDMFLQAILKYFAANPAVLTELIGEAVTWVINEVKTANQQHATATAEVKH
jgi:hypothetical protein